MKSSSLRAVAVLGFVIACGDDPLVVLDTAIGHSSAIAITRDGSKLFVANADADSVAVIDLATNTLTGEVLLGGAHPAPDQNGAFAPAIMPRALVLSPDGKSLYVSGERSGKLYVVDVDTSAVLKSVVVGSEPIGVVISSDGSAIFVACSQDATVVRVDATSLSVAATAHVANEPWALAWDGSTLVATHFLGAAISSIDPQTMTVTVTTIPDTAPRGDKRLAHGQPRGLYDLQRRPKTHELWVAYTLLGTDTAQPDLDFESTAFPALAILQDGTYDQTLSVDAQDVAGEDGVFGDIVSGPHALAFTSDGAYALVADTSSEDVLIVDAASRLEASLVRPLLGHQPEAIAISPDEHHAYVYERNTNDVVVIDLDRSGGVLTAQVNVTIPTLSNDPMPAQIRLGQHLFDSANSDEYPLSTNHWVACATCHMEGRSDAVTWLFEQGPRDTPTNAGGMLGTGFLFRTADRTRVQDYWRTINIEQGGAFDPDDANQSALLDAIASYVNFGIPLPIPPTTTPELVVKGEAIFTHRGCATCHTGPRFTDSGGGNPTLDLAGPVLLHDVGTCSTLAFPDVAHDDIAGHPRAACLFDTPSLQGIASTPPFFHDGSAATLSDAVTRMLPATGDTTPLSADDQAALVEYLRSL